MAVEYRNDIPGRDAYFALFESTGWNREYGMRPEELREAIRGSWHMVNAYADGKLVGSGRIISDGVFHALIVDVIVLPEFQGQGVGTAITERLLAACRAARLRDVQLFCAKGNAPFYRRLGFTDRDAGAPGMDYRQAARSATAGPSGLR